MRVHRYFQVNQDHIHLNFWWISKSLTKKKKKSPAEKEDKQLSSLLCNPGSVLTLTKPGTATWLLYPPSFLITKQHKSRFIFFFHFCSKTHPLKSIYCREHSSQSFQVSVNPFWAAVAVQQQTSQPHVRSEIWASSVCSAPASWHSRGTPSSDVDGWPCDFSSQTTILSDRDWADPILPDPQPINVLRYNRDFTWWEHVEIHH